MERGDRLGLNPYRVECPGVWQSVPQAQLSSFACITWLAPLLAMEAVGLSSLIW